MKAWSALRGWPLHWVHWLEVHELAAWSWQLNKTRTQRIHKHTHTHTHSSSVKPMVAEIGGLGSAFSFSSDGHLRRVEQTPEGLGSAFSFSSSVEESWAKTPSIEGMRSLGVILAQTSMQVSLMVRRLGVILAQNPMATFEGMADGLRSLQALLRWKAAGIEGCINLGTKDYLQMFFYLDFLWGVVNSDSLQMFFYLDFLGCCQLLSLCGDSLTLQGVGIIFGTCMGLTLAMSIQLLTLGMELIPQKTRYCIPCTCCVRCTILTCLAWLALHWPCKL